MINYNVYVSLLSTYVVTVCMLCICVRVCILKRSLIICFEFFYFSNSKMGAVARAWLALRVHYNDVIISAMASQITNHAIVYSTVYSGVDQRKHQSSASLPFVRGIHRRPVNSPHKGPVTRKMFPFDAVIMFKPLQTTYVFISPEPAPQNINWKVPHSISSVVRALVL